MGKGGAVLPVACSRSFKRLFENDRDEAQAVFERVVELILSIS
jgi:hypothetical protein